MHRSILAAAAIIAVVITSTANAQEPFEKARAAFEKGVEDYEAGKVEEALKSFREAYKLNPSWKILFNIGQAEAALKRFGLAIETFEKYLAQGGDEVPVERKDEVLAELDRLRKMTGAVSIEAPDGAEVVVDGTARGTAPLPGRLRLVAGLEHQVVVRRGDEVLLDRTVRVTGGEEISIEVTEEPVEPEPEPAQPEPVVEDDEGGGRVWTWVALGIGAAAGIGAGITGGLASSKMNTLEDNCPDKQCPPTEQGTIDSVKNLATTTDVLIGVAAAGIAAGIILFFVEPGSGDEEPEVAVAPVVTPSGGGVSIGGRF